MRQLDPNLNQAQRGQSNPKRLADPADRCDRLRGRAIATGAPSSRPEFLRDRVGPATEVVQGDVLTADSLIRAVADVRTTYYLVHSMGSSGEFEAEDRQATKNFDEAARAAGVRRIR